MEGGTFVDYFKDLDDPREGNKRHTLIDIVVLTICAVICGAAKWEDIKTFGKAKQSWLKGFLELPHGIPSHNTILRVFAALNADSLTSVFFGGSRPGRSLGIRSSSISVGGGMG